MTVPARLPANESERLARLRELMVLDSMPEPLFDSLTRMASEVCGTPIGLVSLIDAERQWFKAQVGLPGVGETPRDISFCGHAILQDDVLEVPDARHDPRFAANPLVTSAPDIGFYAGAPLILPGGERIGTLCVIDHHARRLSPQQVSTLQQLAQMVSQALVMRRDLIERSLAVRSAHEMALAESEEQHRALLDGQSEMVALSRDDGTLAYVNPSYAAHLGHTPQQMLGTDLYQYVHAADREHVRALVEQVLATGAPMASENRMVEPDGEERWISWTNTRRHDPQGRVMLHSVGRDVTSRKLAEMRLAASERFLRQITDSLPARIAYVDLERRYRFVNRAQAERFGRPRDEVLGRTRSAFLHSEVDPQVRARADLALLGQAQRFEFDELVDGHPRRIDSQLIPDVGEDGAVRGMFTIAIDITERSETERALLRQTATLASVAEVVPAMIAVVGADWRYRFANHAFARWHDLTCDEVIGHQVQQVLRPAEFELLQPRQARAMAGETLSCELHFPERSIQHLAVTYIPLRLDSGALDGFVAVGQDVTQHRREAMRLLDLSQRDALTGLLNRAGFEAWLQQNLAAAGGEAMALLCIDLDHFKPVNDQHGHPAGDAVLRQFGERLRGLVRPTDAVARLGGDEFAVVLAGVRDAKPVQAVADKILAAAHTPFPYGALQLQIGASVGTALGVDPQLGWPELLARADAMLYKAKAQGRGRQAGV